MCSRCREEARTVRFQRLRAELATLEIAPLRIADAMETLRLSLDPAPALSNPFARAPAYSSSPRR